MPEPSASDQATSPPPDTSNDPAAEETSETVDFLPPLVSRLFIAGWILLFSGRWLVVQGLAAAGLVGPEQIQRLDENVLGRCYLLLVSVTLVTLVVRVARSLHPERETHLSKTDFDTPAEPDSTAVGTVEAEASARGGKQA